MPALCSAYGGLAEPLVRERLCRDGHSASATDFSKLPGVLRKNRYTMQWASMFILLFFTEGIVRATSDIGLSRSLAWAEVALSVMFFVATIFYLRPFKRAAKARANQRR